jgi:beta-N-acetylhexosaminidase
MNRNQNTGRHGPVMLDLEGLSVSTTEATKLANPLVGGVILFTRNFADLEQLKRLVGEIRAVNPTCLIAVDHEGGRVQRFRDGFTRLPTMRSLGVLFEQNKEAGLELAQELGWLMASELTCFDIDISFAPVLDRDHGISEIIGDRSFSSSLETIQAVSAAFMNGMRDAGMSNTGKHFPGHGAVEADSHIDIPIDKRSEDTIRQEDMAVFANLAKAGLDAVMPAHVIYSEVDPNPAGFSKYWLQTVLRQGYGFDGVIFSDDLSMEGATVAGSFSERALAALNAGCDMVLVCNNPEAADEVLAALSHYELSKDSSRRISSMRHSGTVRELECLKSSERWKKITDALAQHNKKDQKF